MSSARSEACIDRHRRLASRAFDLKPWVAAVDGLINCRARIDGAAIAPHLFIPALAGEVVRFADQSCRDGGLRHWLIRLTVLKKCCFQRAVLKRQPQNEQQAAIAIIRALRDEITKPLGELYWKKLDWLFRRVCDAFKVDDRIRKYQRKGLNDGV
jgi:hypothetical protein